MFTKGKGKKTREDSQTKIQDVLISPYVIYFDGSTYTLVKEKDSKEENIGYYSTLEGTLKSIAKLLNNKHNVLSISDYIEQYRKIMTSLTNVFNL